MNAKTFLDEIFITSAALVPVIKPNQPEYDFLRAMCATTVTAACQAIVNGQITAADLHQAAGDEMMRLADKFISGENPQAN